MNSSHSLLRKKLQFFDREFEEWVDLIDVHEIPDGKVKIRLREKEEKIQRTPKNTQSEYSFRRTFGQFKSNVNTLTSGESQKNERSQSSMGEMRPKSAARSRPPALRPTSAHRPSASDSGGSSTRPRSAGATRHASKRRALSPSSKDNDSYDGLSKPSHKTSKRKNFTVPKTPKVLQRSIQYRERLQMSYKSRKSAKRKKMQQSAGQRKSSHFARQDDSLSTQTHLSTSLHVPHSHNYSSSVSASYSSLRSPSARSSTATNANHPTSPSNGGAFSISITSSMPSLSECKHTIHLDAKAKKQQQIASALDELKIYNPDLVDKFYALQVFEPNVPVPVHKMIDLLWKVDTQASIAIAKQLEARSLLKYEDHHIIIQNHHQIYLQAQRGDPYQLHKEFLETLSSFCQASNVRFRRPSVENLENDQISIDEVNWCSFDDGTMSTAGRKYFFRQLVYHLVGSKKFHLLSQLLLRPAYLQNKFSLWKESPEIFLRDFEMLEKYGMNTKSHTQIKEALIMSLDYLKDNDHELVSQLLGRLNASKLPVVQSYLHNFIQLIQCADFSWVKPLNFTGLYNCNSGIRLIAAPGGCVQSDFKDYIFNAHGKIAYQRNIHTGLVEKHFPVLDEYSGSEIVALTVTPKRDKLVAAIVTHFPSHRSSDAAAGGSGASETDLPSTSRVECSLRVWDIATGNHLRHIKADQDTHFINKLVATKDGKYVITASKIPVKAHPAHHHVSKDKIERRFREMHYAIQVFDIQKGKLLKYFKGHTSPVMDLCISPSGQYLVSASRKSIRVWDCANLSVALRKQLMEFRINSNPKVKAKQFPLTGHLCLDTSTSEDRYIFAATENGVIQIDFRGNYIQTLAEGLGSITTLAYDALHEHLVLGLEENCKVTVWKIGDDDIVREYKDFYSPAERIVVHNDHYLVDTGVDYRYFLSTRNHISADQITCVSDVVICASKGKYRLLVKSQPTPETPQGAVVSFDLLSGKKHSTFAYIEGDAYLSSSATTAAIRSRESTEYSIKVVDLTHNGQLLQQVVLQEPCFDVKVSRNGQMVFYISPDKQRICTLEVENNRITETDLKLKLCRLFLCASDRFMAIVPNSLDKRPLMLLDTKTHQLVSNRNALPYVNKHPIYFCSQDTNWIWIHSGNHIEIYDVIHDCMIYVFDSNVDNVVRLKAGDNAQFGSLSSFCHLGQYLIAASYQEKKLFVYCTVKSEVKVPNDASQFTSSRPIESDAQGIFKTIHVLRCHLVASYTMDGHVTSVDAVQIDKKLVFVCGIESSENSLCIAEMAIREHELIKVAREMSHIDDYRISMVEEEDGSATDRDEPRYSMSPAIRLEVPHMLPDVSHIEEGYGLESPSYFKEFDETIEDYV